MRRRAKKKKERDTIKLSVEGRRALPRKANGVREDVRVRACVRVHTCPSAVRFRRFVLCPERNGSACVHACMRGLGESCVVHSQG